MSNRLIKEKHVESKGALTFVHHFIILCSFCIVVFLTAASIAKWCGNYQNENVVSIDNPYDEGTALYAAYDLHNVDVTGTMEMSDLEDGTKVYYVLYLDNWTAYVYIHPDGTHSGKVDNIP